jgi:nucleoid DNA-binding protein
MNLREVLKKVDTQGLSTDKADKLVKDVLSAVIDTVVETGEKVQIKGIISFEQKVTPKGQYKSFGKVATRDQDLVKAVAKVSKSKTTRK